MTIHLTHGLGGTSGDSLALASDISVSTSVYYVSSVTGNSSNSGLDRLHPYDTIADAVGVVGAYGIVVLLDGHTETITSAVTVVTAGVTIVGEGSSGGVPTVELTLDHATNDLFNIAEERVQIRNVKITAPAQATTGNMINVQDHRAFLKGVYVEVDKLNDAAALWLDNAAEDVMLEDCTFISVETSTAEADRPYSPVEVDGTSTQTGVIVKDTVFDGGVTGFKAGAGDYYAFEAKGTITGIRMENISLLRGAGIKLGASSTGYVNVGASSGHAEVDW